MNCEYLLVDGYNIIHAWPELKELAAVNLDAARHQGQTYGHGLTRELAFLCAHGMLHLLGYDHMEPVEEREMRALQNDIMNQLGLSVKEAPQQE